MVIGSGNVASALAPALEATGRVEIVCVYSPTQAHASELAKKLRNTVAVSHINDIPTDADIYLMAVKDDAIATLADTLPPVPNALWLHTSGGVEAKTLSPLSSHHGVFYPLQTFSKGVPVEIAEVPFFVEASDAESLTTVTELAKALSPKVYNVDSAKRRAMHAAAVFTCNFTNHLWAIADDILHREAGVDLSVLHPLLKETLRKAMEVGPKKSQTGPAVRADHQVMDRHMALLAEDEAQLYKILSDHIMHYYELD